LLKHYLGTSFVDQTAEDVVQCKTYFPRFSIIRQMALRVLCGAFGPVIWIVAHSVSEISESFMTIAATIFP